MSYNMLLKWSWHSMGGCCLDQQSYFLSLYWHTILKPHLAICVHFHFSLLPPFEISLAKCLQYLKSADGSVGRRFIDHGTKFQPTRQALYFRHAQNSSVLCLNLDPVMRGSYNILKFWQARWLASHFVQAITHL